MKAMNEMLLVISSVFLPVTAILAGLGYCFLETPTGFTVAMAAMAATAASLISVSLAPARRRWRPQRDS